MSSPYLDLQRPGDRDGSLAHHFPTACLPYHVAWEPRESFGLPTRLRCFRSKECPLGPPGLPWGLAGLEAVIGDVTHRFRTLRTVGSVSGCLAGV